VQAGVAVEVSSTGTVAVRTVFVMGAAGTDDPGAVSTGTVAGLGGVAALGGGAAGLGGAGLSGLMPPSQAGPEYMSAVKPLVFHFSSKSAAALFGVSPTPMTSFHG
jgi:hypothetical protein